MKAIIASSVVCTENNSTTNNASNKITKTKHRDIENEEIQMYLSKLKDLVPFMPKNKKLSKLEVIQHVIDYICDLQCALETHPSSALNGFETTAAQTVQLNNNNNNNNNQKKTQNSIICPRQPLGVRQSPNTILNSSSSSCETPSIILQNLTTAEALTPSDRMSIS